MENFGFLISLGHPNYNNIVPHIFLENVFSLFYASKKTCKNCMISGFFSICRSFFKQTFRWSWLSTTWHCFPWLLSLKSCWLKSKPSLRKGWQRHMRHLLAYRKCKLLEAWEPSDVSEEKVTYSTLSPGTVNAIIMKVMEERRPGIFKEKEKRKEALEKASVRGSGPLQIEKLPQQKQRIPWEDAFPTFCFYVRANQVWHWCFLSDISADNSKAESEIRLCLQFILEITQSSAPLFHQHSPFL